MEYYTQREKFIPYEIFEKIYENLWSSLEEYNDEGYVEDCINIYSDYRDPYFLCYYMLEYTTDEIENGSISKGFKYALKKTTNEKRRVVYDYLKYRQKHNDDRWDMDDIDTMLETISQQFKRKITI